MNWGDRLKDYRENQSCHNTNDNLKNDTPGPGQYRIPCSFRDVPRYISSAGNFEEQYRFI